jgi:hypothetical protein
LGFTMRSLDGCSQLSSRSVAGGRKKELKDFE